MIRTEHLIFRYAYTRGMALDDVTVELRPGETVLLLGPSGAGKSTLALCLNGLIPHVIEGEMRGEVLVDGTSTRALTVADLTRRIGIVFQDPESQFCMLTVEDEVAFGLENLQVPQAEMDWRIEQALGLVGLADERRTRLDQLSGGMKQRLALACVLAMRPETLLLDEPTANLDPAGAREFLATLAGLPSARTRLIIEHRLDDLMALIDRVWLMNRHGQIVADGAPRDILSANVSLLDAEGIWLPQVSELAWRLAQHGVSLDPFPLDVEEAAVALRGLPWQHAVIARRCTETPPMAQVAVDPPAVEVRHLSFAYPNRNDVLHDVSWSVPAGDLMALVGPNGSGKTTLAMHLVDILHPPTGTVRILGRDVATLAADELTLQVGYVFQNPEHQFVTDNVYDELAYSLRVRGLDEATVHERVLRLLDDFELAPYVKANPFRLSQGQKRRLSLATMLAVGQRILVLDEPTFGQDRRSAAQIMASLRQLNAQGVTIIMITHEMHLVAQYARHVAVLVDGHMIYQGDVRSLFRAESLLAQASLVPPPLCRLARLLRAERPDFPDLLTLDEWVAAFAGEGA